MPHSTPMNRQESAATIDEKHGAQHLEAGAGQELPTVMEAKELANEGDDAAQALEGQELGATEEELKSLRRRMDFILVPLMACGVGMLLVDKTALGSAATLTLQTDLHLVGTQYSWAVSIYFLGTYPFNLLCQRFHTGKVVGIAYLCWGTVMLTTMAVTDYRGLFVVRFLLGVFESANNPAFVLVTARFWTPEEQPVRYALWALGNTIFPIPFLVIFYAIGTVSPHPLPPWKWIFCLLGCLTLVIGVVMFFVLPDSPSNWRFFTPRQRALAVARIARAQTGIKNHVVKPYQIKEAFLDIKVWICALMLVCQQPAPGIVSNFSGIIIKGYGFTGLQSLLLQIPAWAVPCVATPLAGYLTTYVPAFRKQKSLVIALLSVISLSIYPMINTLVGQNSGGATKRQTAVAIVWSMYCVSNIAVPQSFKASQSPRYQDGVIVTMSAQTALIILSIAFYFICHIENKRRDKAMEEMGVTTQGDKDRILAGLADETDKKNPLFRYLP
ncbi:hypothetical protein EHS25_003326 [Saitozyma podzolica]|uniref:Major facilitator superfamily (MFS) profile domain-containing protein n=1 Tax=Saitozyma podzolica TaxID=1890683 RepID=A0A427Y8I0_9TREE|nr:hypothetical protein EHS25_003326 [Saitozyma podzolica]